MERETVEYWRKLRAKLGRAQLILPGADGAVMHNGRILLVRNRNDGRWYLPGGLQDLDESIEETAEREIAEEIGLCLKVDCLVSVYSSPRWIRAYPNGDIIQALTFFFLMQGPVDPDSIRLQQEELSDCGFFAPDALPDGTCPYSAEMCRDLAVYKGRTLLR